MSEAVIVAIISTAGVIITAMINKKTNKKVDSLESMRNDFNEHILDADKTFLTNFLSEVENGVEKTEIQKKRAHEIYERYSKNGGNSYVHDKWEEVKRKELL